MIQKLLGLFSGVNPVHLAIAAGAIALVSASAGFGVGWTVNGWRLGVRVATLDGDKRELTIGAQACGSALETQNAAVAGWQAAALEKEQKGADAKRQAEAFAKRLQPELERLIGLAGQKAVAGVVRRCEDATAEVRRGLQP